MKRPAASNSPMTERRSIGRKESNPRACISGPPIPLKRASGSEARIARMSRAPRRSPDISPATNAMEST